MARMLKTLLASTAICAAFAAPAAAADQTVDCNNAELQPALDQAQNGDVITVVEGTTCNGGFELREGTEITLQGAGSGATLDGDGEARILRGFNAGETVIRNLRFEDGVADEGEGGAINLEGLSPVTIEDNRFVRNVAHRGGAIAINDYLPLLTRADGVRDVTLRDNVFGGEGIDGNLATDRGGAVVINAQSDVDVTGNTFTNNESLAKSGGGLYLLTEGKANLAGNTFEANLATAKGGGATVRPCEPSTITGNVFTGNVLRQQVFFPDQVRELSEGPRGAGLHLELSFCDRAARQSLEDFDFVQSGNRFERNVIEERNDQRPPGGGGGEAVEGASVLSTNDRYFANKIHNRGAEGGGLSVENFGGEIVFEGRNLVAASNDVEVEQEESARAVEPTGEGGGIYVGAEDGTTHLQLFDSTVAANSAAEGSGIAGDARDALTLYNSIVHGNVGDDDEISGFFIDVGKAEPGTRDVRFSIACDEEGGAEPGESNLCVDPELADPHEGDVHQTAGSPSLNSGSNALVPSDLTTDYEGDERIGGATVDRGADEVPVDEPQPTPPPTPGATPQPQPQPQGAVQGVQRRSCTSRRVFRIRLRVPRGEKAVSATVRVNGKAVRVLRGRRLRAPVVLRGLPKGRVTVRISIRLESGERVTGTRTYYTCRRKLPGVGPPPV